MFGKFKMKEVARCYRAVFLDNDTGRLSQEGRVVMKDILACGKVGDTSFDEDPMVMARNSGKMELANRIRAMVASDIDLFEQIEELEEFETFSEED